MLELQSAAMFDRALQSNTAEPVFDCTGRPFVYKLESLKKVFNPVILASKRRLGKIKIL